MIDKNINKITLLKKDILKELNSYPYFYREIILNKFLYKIRGNQHIDNSIQIEYINQDMERKKDIYIKFDIDLLINKITELEA